MASYLRCPRILSSVGLLSLALLAITEPSAAQKFAYVANFGSNNVSAYTIGGTGALTLVGTYPAGTNPLSVAVDPDGQFVYVANRGRDDPSIPSEISGYSIDPMTGALTPVLCSPFRAGIHPYSVTVDPTGQFVYVANFNSNNVSAYVIKRIGDLLPFGGSPFQAGIHPYSVTVDPTGQFVYVANLGSNNVSAYTIDACTGVLTLVGTYPAGTSPLSVTVDPTGQFVYVANSGSNNVSAYTIGGGGVLTLVGSYPAGTSPYSVTVDSTGQFVYVANFGSNNVSAYTIGGGGVLTLVGTYPAGTSPLSVTTTP